MEWRPVPGEMEQTLERGVSARRIARSKTVSGRHHAGSVPVEGYHSVKFPKKLRYYCDLDDDMAKPLLDMPGRIMEAPRGTDLIVAGDAPTYGFVVEAGWAIRYTLLADGRRQVLNVLMPGDMFDLQVFIAAEADHSVTAITDMTVKTFKAEDLLNIFNLSGRLAQALWWASVQEEAMLREQIVRNGRRNAAERIAHFLLELHRRALIVDEGSGTGFRLPLTQTLIGDALGLTSIHVNRVLKRFRDEGMKAIAEHPDHTWKSNRAVKNTVRKPVTKAKTSPLPKFGKPVLATLVDEVPSGDDWLFEIKFDGYRAIAAASGGEVRIYTRNALDWTAKYPAIAQALGIAPSTGVVSRSRPLKRRARSSSVAPEKPLPTLPA